MQRPHLFGNEPRIGRGTDLLKNHPLNPDILFITKSSSAAAATPKVGESSQIRTDILGMQWSKSTIHIAANE
jgi:hypothetical protein